MKAVLEVERRKMTAIVEGLRMVTKHSKPTTENPQGGILEGGPIHIISNLMSIDPKSGEPTRGPQRRSRTGTGPLQQTHRRSDHDELRTEASRQIPEGGGPALQKEFGYKSPMQVPCLVKISINQGLGAAVAVIARLSNCRGRDEHHRRSKAVPTVSKRDISNFKLREGHAHRLAGEFAGDRMFEFLDRPTPWPCCGPATSRVKASGFDGRATSPSGRSRSSSRRRHRQDRPDPGHGHHVRDHCEDRPGGQGPAEGLRLPVRRQGQAIKPEERWPANR